MVIWRGLEPKLMAALLVAMADTQRTETRQPAPKPDTGQGRSDSQAPSAAGRAD